jgi:hypothetical protein
MQIRIIKTVLLLFSASLLFSCNPYKKTTLTNDALYNKRRLAGSYKKYVILVHEPKTDSTFRLENVVFEKDTIYAELNSLLPQDTTTKGRKTKRLARKRVYLELNDDFALSEAQNGSQLVLPKTKVNKVEMYAKKQRGFLGILGTIVLLILAAILALLVTLLIAILTSDTSGSTSGNSNSGGTGGGNSSSSSCYVATMVYGSSESDEVLVLRAFRDKVLAKNQLGRAFILWYYRNSPSFVARWNESGLMTRSIRAVLNPLVRYISLLLKR